MFKISEILEPVMNTAQACAGGVCGVGGGRGGWAGPMMGWGGGGWGVFGAVFGIIFWVAIIVAIVYLIKHLTQGGYHHRCGQDANEVLKMRYARGEITKEDYERMKKELEKM